MINVEAHAASTIDGWQAKIIIIIIIIIIITTTTIIVIITIVIITIIIIIIIIIATINKSWRMNEISKSQADYDQTFEKINPSIFSGNNQATIVYTSSK